MIGWGNARKSASQISSLCRSDFRRLLTKAAPLPSLSFSSSATVTPPGEFPPSDLLVFLQILRRALPDPLRHLREFAFGNLVLDGLDVDLVPPVIAEVEPVAEALPDFQPQ